MAFPSGSWLHPCGTTFLLEQVTQRGFGGWCCSVLLCRKAGRERLLHSFSVFAVAASLALGGEVPAVFFPLL